MRRLVQPCVRSWATSGEALVTRTRRARGAPAAFADAVDQPGGLRCSSGGTSCCCVSRTRSTSAPTSEPDSTTRADSCRAGDDELEPMAALADRLAMPEARGCVSADLRRAARGRRAAGVAGVDASHAGCRPRFFDVAPVGARFATSPGAVGGCSRRFRVLARRGTRCASVAARAAHGRLRRFSPRPGGAGTLPPKLPACREPLSEPG